MRSNRSGYSSSPAGSAKALDQKPRPRRSKREWNQILLMVFFVVLPVLGLLAIFFQPFRWLFMICSAVAIGFMWLIRAFLFPGRTILTAIYGLVCIFTLVTALSHSGSTKRTQQQNVFITVAPVVQQTPMNNYSIMGTNVPIGYYDQEDESSTGTSGSDDTAGAYAPENKSGAEIALENFMESWRRGIIDDMLANTPVSWQESVQGMGHQQLFWKFGQRELSEWRQMTKPTGTEANLSRTITVQADVDYSGEIRTYEYDAIALFENDKWSIDPNSLSSGILKEQATPTPDPNATPTPSPTPSPTPTINPKLQLYYNKKGGGVYYHADKECKTINKKWFPLESFNYSSLVKEPYSKLLPCEDCGAPQ